jgi:hypothetical protein
MKPLPWETFKPESLRTDINNKVWDLCILIDRHGVYGIRENSEVTIMWPCGRFVFQGIANPMYDSVEPFHEA